jgi:hypothetical protein
LCIFQLSLRAEREPAHAGLGPERYMTEGKPREEANNMSKITPEDLAKVQEPCKSCDIYATGSGKNKTIYCKALKAKLMGGGNRDWFPVIDCPKKKTKDGGL